MPKISDRGFTLIEVLIASVILFLFITMASQVYSQAAHSSRKAERAAKVAAIVPLLVDGIRDDIELAQSTAVQLGNGKFEDIDYQWRATLAQRKPPIPGFDPATEEFRSFEDKYNLWKVELTVSVGQYQRQWIYEELSWHEE